LKRFNLSSSLDIPKLQDEVLEFWRENNIFEKSVQKNKKGEIVFYDGPPFPTGKPHHGTVLVSFIKDMIARYWTMQGYSVPRVWGWDCHGLPIETQAETALGIKDKKEIESSVGVDKFNDQCFDIVSANNETWRKYVEKMARWVDYEGAYKTMNPDYMESVLWTFKQCYDKGLIYKDYRVTPYCFRCETSLSLSDTRESDSTRPRQDPWVIAKFATGQEMQGMPVYFLAWTTTPWTLPSNMALAVGADIGYAYAVVGSEVYVGCESLMSKYPKVFGDKPQIIARCKGEDLIGKKYTPLFSYFKEKEAEGAFRVIGAGFIDASEGIGIVHIAPAFGEDDYWVAKSSGVPLVNPVDHRGLFTDEVGDFAGRNVIEANQDIIRFLRARNQVIADGTIEHNYPHCWRCRQPLIYKAMEAWYLNIEMIKDRLIEVNNEINWVPESVKYGRFGNWLANARDWNISRNRYWSTPIPVWECEQCGKRRVLGSVQEIYEASGKRLTNLHKQYMDEVVLTCECGGTMKRIPEVIDCWFESAAVPYAQKHYPFENKDWFETHHPSDFVVEYTGQIRCWFYYLHVMSVALFDKPAFKNCVVHGTVLAKDGKKLSKSSKNYTDPMLLMDKYGTDAFRLYMYQSNAMLIGDLLFEESGILGALQQILLPFWNACSFFASYANIDGFSPDSAAEPESDNQLDRWILAKLYETEKAIADKMDRYQVNQYVGYIAALIDGLTNWYIRRSRRRFWGSDFSADKKSGYATLYYVLVNTCKLLAPVAPIIAEKLYKELTGETSVHLADWPDIPQKYKDERLLKELDTVQEIIHLARSIRSKSGINNRQPLTKLLVALSDSDEAADIEKYRQVIGEELNVKEVEFIDNVETIASVHYLPNLPALGPRYGKQLGPITKAIKEKQFQYENGGIKLTLPNGENILLEQSDVIVNYQAKEGLHIMNGFGIVVSLDLTLTDALRREGLAREIVRKIQDSRKQLGLQISDRIGLQFTGGCPEEWVDYILSETLGDICEISIADAQIELEDEKGGPVVVKIQKKA